MLITRGFGVSLSGVSKIVERIDVSIDLECDLNLTLEESFLDLNLTNDELNVTIITEDLNMSVEQDKILNVKIKQEGLIL